MRSFVDVDLGREPVPDETRPSRCRVFGMFMLSHSRVVYWMHDKAAGSPATGIFRSLLDLDPSRYPAGSSYAPMPAAWCRTLTRRAQWSLRSSGFSRKGMNIRMSGGKPSYSHVVTVSGSGKIVYTAGQLARDIDGNCVGKGDMRAQMEQTFQNLDRCLKAAGATWADVVKTNTFVTDFDEFQKCADIRMRYLGVATPTSTTVGVTRLAGPDFMIEIEAVAAVNS
jgi:enamine deaminase RidA (YjgF/YER057c/UK114 family)